MAALLLAYITLSTSALAVACMITLFTPQFGSIIAEFTTYGKTNEQRHKNVTKWFAVPKRWFRHFYLLAVLTVSATMFMGYEFSTKARKSEDFVPHLRALTNKSPQISFNMGMTVLGLILFHVTRRAIETLFISIYSDTSMNIFHYLLGLVHYAILPLTIACETLGFASKSVYPLNISVDGWTQMQLVGLGLFFYANFEQFKCARYLASCRTAPKGGSPSSAHSIPYGGWFDVVSCPHFLFECIIYGSLLLILPSGVAAFKYLTGFVLVNQVFAALITHRWYRGHFKDYPPQRRAILPYIL